MFRNPIWVEMQPTLFLSLLHWRESFCSKDKFQALQHCTPEKKYFRFSSFGDPHGPNINFNFVSRAKLTFPIPHFPFSSLMVLWKVRITVSWDLFEVVSSSSKERETVPQDGLNDLSAMLVSVDSVAEVDIGEVVDDGVHGLCGEQLVYWGLNSYFVAAETTS